MKLELNEGDKDQETKFVIDKTRSTGPSRTQPFLVQAEGRPQSFTKPIPKSDLLDRLSDFLPKLKKSNEALADKDPAELNIESVPEGARHIQMDLGLGIFDMESEKNNADGLDQLVMPGTEKKGDSIAAFFGADSCSSSDEESDDSAGSSHESELSQSSNKKKLIEEL